LRIAALQHVAAEDKNLLSKRNRFEQLARATVLQQLNQLDLFEKGVIHHSTQHMSAANQLLRAQTRELEALDPKRVFARGFSLTTRKGKILTSAKEVSAGDEINTSFGEESINSKVI
jgi:exonuclease VII large subunit